MYCPTCGKETPENSTFCLHCGTKISSPGVRAVIEWEYKDFVYAYPKNWSWCRLGAGAYTEAGARLEFWQSSQSMILAELQKWLDEGWEPVGEVGPSSIVLRSYKAFGKGVLDRTLSAAMVVGTYGVGLLFARTWYAEPVEFRVQMRRPKS